MIGVRGVPANYSGIEAAVEELGSRLVARGNDVTVFCMHHWYEEKRETHKGMRLAYVKTVPSKNLEMIVYAARATVAALSQDFDLIHFHAIGPATMVVLPWLLKRRTVVTVHALDWRNEKWSLPAQVYLRLGEYLSARLPTRTIAVSKTLRAHFAARHKRTLDYIPNGVSLLSVDGDGDGDVLARLGLTPGRYIIFVGRLTRPKQVHTLVEAFCQVKTPMRLCIVGGEKDITVAELAAFTRGDPRVVFAGPIYGDDQARLLKSAYLYVLPSILEGLPISLMEGMAYGNAVLVSDIAENLEVIRNGDALHGIAFRAGDVDDLRARLQQAVNDPSLVARLREPARDWVLKSYDWDRIAEDTARLYASAVGEGMA